MNAGLLKEFKSPGSKYRGAPFWAWNGKLDPEELRRQVRVMHRMGLGGFFMHSRVGLDTAYLSDEWFECVKACIDEAEKLDMQAWLYDEDRWPSGAAGGLVTKNPRYRRRALFMEVLKGSARIKWDMGTIAVFAAKVKGSTASDVRRLPKSTRRPKLKRGESVLRFFLETDPCSSWYNGYTYLDTMDRDAVKEFIKVTHEAYRKNVGRHFGRRVPGIFTDEPNHGHYFSQSVPWTRRLRAVFRKRYGYDIISRLPEIFLDVDGEKISQARYHYHDCTTHMFVDAFARQIGRWCDKNGIEHTGHVLCEQALASQTNVVGNCMRFYEYMQAPGMDILTEHAREYDTAKQVSSVARQFDRKWRLTETYGCTGWDFPFVGHKAIGDWQAALGINLRCQHLSWYTMEGQAKRDYPAGIFYQSPWWELYPKVEDYFARVHAVMTQGREVRDLLVIHPVESMWTMTKVGWRGSAVVKNYDSMIIALRDSLLAENVDFDYGDEEMLARHGKMGRTGGKAVIRVGKASYRAVVVPQLRTMRSSTLRLLGKFRAAGGRVVFAGGPAKYVDALPSKAAVEFARSCSATPAKGRKIARAVEDVARRVSITNGRGRQIVPALHLLREDSDAYYLFVCNTGHATGQIKPITHDPTMVRDRRADFPKAHIRGFSECAGRPLEMDLNTGEIFSADAERGKDGWDIHTSLPPIGSRVFVIPKKKGGKRYPARKKLKTARSAGIGGAKWGVSLSESNVLVLDRPEYKIGSAPWQKADEILRVDHAVRDAFGIPRRGGQMVQPWARKRSANLKRKRVALSYKFQVSEIPSGDMFLALERMDTFEIKMNGVSLSADAECGWWCDMSLRRVRVDPAILRLGRNEVVLTCDYDENHPGLEIAYLLGDFGVEVKGTDVIMTARPDVLKIGDWVKQGLPFYSGSVSYYRTIKPKLRKGERLFVRVPDYRGVAVRVLVDGRSAGVIAWEPNEVDITDLVSGGSVDLAIEVIGHRRNSHGPLHLNEKWPTWTGPGQYVTSGKEWIDSYQLVPCGLMDPPRLVVLK